MTEGLYRERVSRHLESATPLGLYRSQEPVSVREELGGSWEGFTVVMLLDTRSVIPPAPAASRVLASRRSRLLQGTRVLSGLFPSIIILWEV